MLVLGEGTQLCGDYPEVYVLFYVDVYTTCPYPTTQL